MTWYFHNSAAEFTEDDVGDNFGFVYIITHKKTGQKYIGKKFFTKSKTKQVKGKKITVLKTKPKKKYTRTRGHRQAYTRVQIDELS